jgi:hypothetical protein
MNRLLALFILSLCLPLTLAGQQPALQWQPIVEMNGQFFPSYVLATANKESEAPDDPYYIGDPDGYFGASLVNPARNTKITIYVQAEAIAKTSGFQVVLPEAGKTYELFPKIEYRFDVLSRIQQPQPTNVTISLYLNDTLAAQKTITVRLRALSDCLRGYMSRGGEYVDMKWMFAAYVNEDHPWIDSLLREALNTGLVDDFIGYQGTQKDIYQQVFAVWNVLQKRGFQYSSITNVSSTSSQVYSQHVRLFDDAIRTSQANCVDGSVMLASILRKIGIEPFLVLVPGHCFLGFYLDDAHRTFACLETTMMGQGQVTRLEADGTLLGELGKVFGYETKNTASAKVFMAAINQGNQKYKQASTYFDCEQPQCRHYQLVSIEKAREEGISPIIR